MDAFSSNSTTFEERFPLCEAPFVFVKNEYLVAMIFLRRARRLNAGRGRSAGSESVWFSMTQLFCKRCKTRDESLRDGYIMSDRKSDALFETGHVIGFCARAQKTRQTRNAHTD